MQEMLKTFKEQGLVAVDPVEEPFDPLLHEAIATQESDELPAGHVFRVHQKGYKLWDRVIRPASVTVTKEPSTND